MAGLNGLDVSKNFSSLNVNPANALAAQTTGKSGGTAPVATTPVADQAKIGSAGSLIEQALSTSDVRHDKVSQLQEAIANGTYSVSSADVASKIVDSLLG